MIAGGAKQATRNHRQEGAKAAKSGTRARKAPSMECSGTRLLRHFTKTGAVEKTRTSHGLSATTTSTLRVYQFRHDRTRVCRGCQALAPR